MGNHRTHAGDRYRLSGGLLLAVAAVGAAAAASGSAGTANASCASISGISAGSSGGSTCTSTPTSFAIGIGGNTFASAKGLFTGAIAIGTNNTGPDTTIADSEGALSLAYANGRNTAAVTTGNLAVAVAQGDRTAAQAGATPGDNGNVAVNVAQGETVNGVNFVLAAGQGNLAANLGGVSDLGKGRFSVVQAVGLANAAFNVGGKGNFVSAGNVILPGAETGIPFGTTSTGGVAFNAFGNDNTVSAVGPLAIAGAIGKDGLNGANHVLQNGPGININNL